MDEITCDLCGEGDGEFTDDLVAEWWDGENVQLAHADCVPSDPNARDERLWTLA